MDGAARPPYTIDHTHFLIQDRMVEQQFRIAEIEISKNPVDEKIMGIFRYEGNSQTKKGSTIVIVAEIMSTLYVYERLLDALNSITEQAKHLVAQFEQDPITRFEKLIQRLNETVASFTQAEPTPLAWNRVNIFILEFSGDQLCLTGIGKLMNLFLQKQPDGTYRTFDLFGSLDQPAEVNPQKPFASLICGDMKAGDLLFAGTQNLERLRNELNIKERLTTLPPVSAALEIRQDLEQRNTPDDFLGVVVASCLLERAAPSSIPKPLPTPDVTKSTDSIHKLRETERDASQHLSPSIGPTASLKASAKTPQRIAQEIQSKLGHLWGKFSQTRTVRDVAAMASLRGMNAGHGSAFTKKHKTTALILGAILVLGLTSIVLWRRNQAQTAEAAAWQTTFDQAQDNRNRAESDLVYANDSRAIKEVETANSLLASLSINTADRQKKVSALQEDLKQFRERLRKTVVAQPVIELTALTGVPDGSLSAPVLNKNTAYAVDNSTKTILKIDLSTKTTKRIQLPQNAEPIVAGSLGKQSIVFTTADGTFFALDLASDSIATLKTQSHTSTTNDLVLYAGKAYSLDGVQGKVWRASSNSTGFGAEQAYIKANSTALTNAVSLAIDSNVYILESDGTLLRFLSGGQEGFKLNPIDPPLRAASAVWTNVDATKLAVTDPAEKRILIFSKDGFLKAQITSPDFHGPRDIDGDETNKRLLIVDGTRLLLIPLP